ncbi:bifunctional DNA primase/polymerase [Mycobacteroides abscessus subsp. abscessus]|uniref:bifunctional DNA primase/polymerase n=1 Tax=Mycobacteroides abscessus TaxID=36809 RepID=UPI00266D5CDD|nr:bifunctional DNA primase/polymerase [Mycobacteroides abscessus]MDO3013216.1 bifunctional DNA primase/polymerase [Mycobacteroides abscessus subsp. abscessus]
MIGTAMSADPLASVLASRNAGDKHDLAAYAGHLIKAGVEVVLVEPNGKTPLDFRTEAMKRADAKTSAHLRGDGTVKAGWYSGTRNAARAKKLLERAAEQGIDPNLGVHIGGSRYVLVDMDNAGDVAAAQALWASHGDILPPVTVRTPGQRDDDGRMEHDGRAGHLWLRLPESVDPATLRSYSEPLSTEAKEAQGRGGYAVMAGVGKGALLPPSVRAEGSYVYLDSGITEAPAWLVELLTKPVRVEGERDGQDTRSEAIAAWEDNTSWASLLEPRGWTLTGNTETCGCSTWTRPGKNTHGAKSAVAHEPACDALGESTKRGALHLYSDAGPFELGGERTWSKLAFVAAMEQLTIPEVKDQLGIVEDAPEVDLPVLGAELGRKLGEKLAAKRAHLTVVPDDNDDEKSVEAAESGTEKNPFGVPPLHPSQMAEIESAVAGGFWRATPLLQWIAATAESEESSAFGLLASLLANRMTAIPHWVVLPRRNGTTPSTVALGGSLNLGVVLVGESGSGKTETIALANGIHPAECDIVGDGTGQGWLKKYAHIERQEDPQTKLKSEVLVRDRWALMVQSTEIQGFTADWNRQGSKTDAVLRQFASGDAIGNVTSAHEREANLEKGSYRFVAVVGAQPGHLEPLFTDAQIEGGTPQRFVLVPVSPDAPRGIGFPSVTPDCPVPLYSSAGPAFLAPNGGQVTERPFVVELPPAARAHMAADRLARSDTSRGYLPTLGMNAEELEAFRIQKINQHLTLTRLKVMVGIAALHGRVHPTDVDWELSGVVIRVHQGMLAGVWEVVRQASDARSREAGRQHGVHLAAADASRADVQSQSVSRVASRLRKHLAAHGPTAGAALRRVLASRDRHLFRPAVQELADTGQLVFDGTSYSTVVTFQSA